MNSNSPGYYLYGGRGIKVFGPWVRSFKLFYDEVGPRPTPTHSIDRIDHEADYVPGNVRWATKTQQVLNRRLSSHNKSGYKGVHWNRDKSRWQARAFVAGKTLHIGYFNDVTEAAWMYDQYMLVLHNGEAALNFDYAEMS